MIIRQIKSEKKRTYEEIQITNPNTSVNEKNNKEFKKKSKKIR